MDFNQYNSRRSLLNHECSSVLILHRVLSEKSGHSGTEAILGTQRFSQYRPFKKPCFCADRGLIDAMYYVKNLLQPTQTIISRVGYLPIKLTS